MGTDAIGASLSIFSSVISNVGINLQKRVHLANDKRPLSQKVPYTKVPEWWIGLGGVVLGAIGDFIALGLASQALCTAVGGATTLWANILIARFWLKEELTAWDVGGVFLIVAGATTIAVMTPAQGTYTLANMVSFMGATNFMIYAAALLATVIFLLAGVANSTFYRLRRKLLTALNRPLVRRMDRLQTFSHMLLLRLELLEQDRCDDAEHRQLSQEELADRRDDTRERAHNHAHAELRLCRPEARWRLESLSAHSSSSRSNKQAMIDILEESDAVAPKPEYCDWTDAYTYAATAGTVGACTVIFAGCVSKTIAAAVKGNNQFGQPAPYFFLAGMIATIMGQQALLNAALELGPIMTVFPIFQAFFVGFGVVGGIVFYQVKMSSLAWGLHWFSAAAMIAGCGCLMKHGKDSYVEEHGEIEHELGDLENTGFLSGRASAGGGGDDGGGGGDDAADAAEAASAADATEYGTLAKTA